MKDERLKREVNFGENDLEREKRKRETVEI